MASPQDRVAVGDLVQHLRWTHPVGPYGPALEVVDVDGFICLLSDGTRHNTWDLLPTTQRDSPTTYHNRWRHRRPTTGAHRAPSL